MAASLNGLDATVPGASRPSIQLIQELVFSLNLAVVMVAAFVFRGLFVPFVRLASLMNAWLGLKSIDAAGGYIAFFLSALGLATVSLLLLRSFSSRAGELIRSMAGPIGIIGAPLCWFYIVRWYGWYPLEVAVVLLWMTFYLLKGALVHPLLGLLVLLVHFGFWTIRFWEYTRYFGAILVPIFGFLYCMIWMKYRDARR